MPTRTSSRSGRAASAELTFSDLTALRFALGFVALSVTAMVTGTSLAVGGDAVDFGAAGKVAVTDLRAAYDGWFPAFMGGGLA